MNDAADPAPPRPRPASGSRPGPGGVRPKGPAAFRTISEASAELGVPQHVLRFWETRFAFIRPTKRAGGRRFYRPQDLEVLRGVRRLLQDDGYTIKGVQKLHREGGLKRLLADAASVPDDAALPAQAAGPTPAAPPPEATARLTPGAPEGEEEADTETLDLFGETLPPRPDVSTAAEIISPPAPEAETVAEGRPVLDAAARGRLSDVLGDLEATKAQIDALLRGG